MKLFSKGPSAEGPKPMGVRRAFMGMFAMLAVACAASPAFAQYTVEAGKSVQIPIPPAPHQGSWDGPRDDGWANGRAPLQGTISYPDMQSGMLTGTATYTARANASGSDYIQWAFRCEPVGTPWPCGGGSATITITPSGPPTLADKSINVAYKGSGNTSFSPTSGGNLRIGSSPLKGTASVYNGTSVRYQAADLAYGSDSFTVISANEKGDSQPATVTVNIGNPPPPVAKTITMRTYSSVVSGTPEVDGVYDRLEITVQPTRGVLSVTGGGKSLTWDSQGFNMGPDEFCLGHGNIRAVGVGGTGPTVAISLCSSAPRETTVSGGSVSILANTSGTHDFAPTNDGVVSISTDPASGTITLNGSVATYTPHPDFMGSDSFAAFATNIAGPSAPVTVNVTVNPPPIPTVSTGSLSLAFNASGTHDFAPTQGGTLAIASVASHGTVTINGGRATYVPNPDFIGDDSFSATATNLGGTSAPATVNVTVAPPPIPTLTGGSIGLAFNESGTHDFAPTQGGTLALASAPSHGDVTISGGKATYTPNPDYIGADSFSVTATNLGGTSQAVTATISVSPPAAPGAGSASLSTGFDTVGSVSLPASGLFTSVEIVDAPEHGEVVVVGTTASYTPDAGYFGADSFTYRAVGLGGSSGAASVAVMVAKPDAPVVTPVSATAGHGETLKIPLQVSGLFTTVRLGAAPTHGSAVIVGTELTYTPAGGFSGREAFTVIAAGPADDSAAAEIVIEVGAAPEPPPPIKPTPGAQPGPMAMEGQGGAAMRFRVAQGLAVAVTAVEVVSQPATGVARVEDLDVIYDPPADFVGQVDFGYRVVTADGPSEVATLTAIVHATAAEAPVKEAVASPDVPGSVELTEGVEGGPFSDAAIVSMSPVTAGTAELIRGGAAPARSSMRAFAAAPSGKMSGQASAMAAPENGSSFRLQFKPADDYFGEVVVRYSLTNRYAAPTMGTVRFMVDTRIDPSRDPKVAATLNAQAQAAARFGEAQIANVGRRMETVRSGGGGAGISLSAARPTLTTDPFVDQSRGQMLADLRAAVSPQVAAGAVETSPNAKPASGPVAVWTGGVIELGERRERVGSGGFDFATSGVSLGADVRLSDQVVVGAGVGLGHDRSDLGEGSKVEADAISAFGYGSWKPTELLFLDAVVGFGRLDFDTTRQAAGGALLRGSRSGDQWFAAISSGLEFNRGALMLSPYGRVEAMSTRLSEYAEQGDQAKALRFAAQNLEQVTGVVGLRGSYRVVLDRGVLEPTLRGEYHWSLRESGVARLGYAYGSDVMPYEVLMSAFDEYRAEAGVGLRWITLGGWSYALEVEGRTSQGGSSTTLRVGGSGTF